MPKEIEVVEVESSDAAVIEARLDMADIPAKIMPLMDRVWAFIRAGGVAGHGHNIWIYRHRSDGQMDVEIGVQVAAPFVARDGVVCIRTPGGRAAHAVHIGPYDQLRSAHAAVRAWCAEQGLNRAGVDWELYSDYDPDPAKNRTDVYHLLK
jgi:effector-binding domain-containing protein